MNLCMSPKSGDTTNILWNVVDKSLSTLFKKSAMRVRFGQSIVQNVAIALAMKVMYNSAMVYMYNAIKVIDNAMINITYAWYLNESRLWGHEIISRCWNASRFLFPRPGIIYFCIFFIHTNWGKPVIIHHVDTTRCVATFGCVCMYACMNL